MPFGGPTPSEEDCARALVAHLPVSFINLVETADYKGGPLIDLPETNGVKTPTAKEISRNYTFLKPVVLKYPSKAPINLPTKSWHKWVGTLRG